MISNGSDMDSITYELDKSEGAVRYMMRQNGLRLMPVSVTSQRRHSPITVQGVKYRNPHHYAKAHGLRIGTVYAMVDRGIPLTHAGKGTHWAKSRKCWVDDKPQASIAAAARAIGVTKQSLQPKIERWLKQGLLEIEFRGFKLRWAAHKNGEENNHG